MLSRKTLSGFFYAKIDERAIFTLKLTSCPSGTKQFARALELLRGKQHGGGLVHKQADSGKCSLRQPGGEVLFPVQTGVVSCTNVSACIGDVSACFYVHRRVYYVYQLCIGHVVLVVLVRK